MLKRTVSIILALVMLFTLTTNAFACNEAQTESVVTALLFGDNAEQYIESDKTKMLLAALYLSTEQAGGNGEDKWQLLKDNKLRALPKFEDISISEAQLMQTSHQLWEDNLTQDATNPEARQKVLESTLNKLFYFGFFNKLFNIISPKCEALAELLYYSHILADYIEENESFSGIYINGEELLAYSGAPYIVLNDNLPAFTDSELSFSSAFAQYSELDALGRAGTAFACLGEEIMPPPNSRQDIGAIKPTGWHQERYPDIVNSNPPYLYNRCHLIGHQLAGNDTEENLITGTRYFNVNGMKGFEDRLAAYLKESGNHVLYRVTPVYVGDNPLAYGVQMEAYSIEDNGEGICFDVFCYNAQPGVELSFESGENRLYENTAEQSDMLSFAYSETEAHTRDLIFEIKAQLEVLFEGQAESAEYIALMSGVDELASAMRAEPAEQDPKSMHLRHIENERREYDLLFLLTEYVPRLLQNEKFFTIGQKSN